MAKKILESVIGIENYPVFSLLLFFIVFSVMLLIVATMKKSHAVNMGHIPLDSDNTQGNENE